MKRKTQPKDHDLLNVKLMKRIDDIIKLVEAGFTNTIISLAVSKKHSEDTSEEFVKIIRNEFYVYDGRHWMNRKTGNSYYTNETLTEFDALKIINGEPKPL